MPRRRDAVGATLTEHHAGANPLQPVDHQKGLKRAFFDVSIGGIRKGRILMELFDDTVPKTVNNLCGNQLQAPFNLGSLVVGVGCCSLDTVECVRGTSCPSLGQLDSLVDVHTGQQFFGDM